MSDAAEEPSALTLDEAIRLMDQLGDQITAEQLRAIIQRLGPSIPVAEALKLAHELDKRVTYRGLNAVQVQALKKLTADDWKDTVTRYLKWRKLLAGQNVGLRLVLLAAAAIAYVLLEGSFRTWAGGFAVIVAATTFLNLHRDQVHREAWLEGFESGVDEGVDRALGISREEGEDVHRRAIQMEIDAGRSSR